jgi:hypothetical protein
MLARQIVARVACLGLLLLAAVLLWAGLWRPAIQIRRVGLTGLLPESGRRCEDAPATPWRHCSGAPRSTPHRSDASEQLVVHRRTRRITLIARAWSVPDSADWSRQLDSLTDALDEAGGTAMACPSPPASSVGIPSIERFAAWRFPEQDVRVLGMHDPGAQPGRPRWQIQVMGYPTGYSGCGAWVRDVRWLTPAEVVERVQTWIGDSRE